MEITAPGYIGVKSSQLDQWSQMATGLLGMQQVDRGGGLRTFRIDDRKQRLIVDGSSDTGSALWVAKCQPEPSSITLPAGLTITASG